MLIYQNDLGTVYFEPLAKTNQRILNMPCMRLGHSMYQGKRVEEGEVEVRNRLHMERIRQ